MSMVMTIGVITFWCDQASCCSNATIAAKRSAAYVDSRSSVHSPPPLPHPPPHPRPLSHPIKHLRASACIMIILIAPYRHAAGRLNFCALSLTCCCGHFGVPL